MKKLSIAVLSAIMAMLMLVLTPTQIIAKAEAKVYVEDIIIVAAKDEDEAQSLAGEDYLVLREPIYDGSADTGENTRTKKSFLCYKTTNDPTNAITEIKALNMNAPWDYDTYNNYIKQIKKDIKVEVKALCKSIEEFQSNYGANTEDETPYPKSLYAYNVLQYLYDDDILTHENEDLRKCARLGDLFLAFDFEDEDSAAEAEAILVDILLESNAQCVNIIYNALTLACSETEETSFLDIISAPNFNANIYLDSDELNSEAADIINTISETQKEIKKYLESQEPLDESIYETPDGLDAVDAAMDRMIEFYETDSLDYFDQYVKIVLQKDSASVSDAEKRILFETMLCELIWYQLDNEDCQQNLKSYSFINIYLLFGSLVYSLQRGELSVEDYNAKIQERIALFDEGKLSISKEFSDLLKLYESDLACYNDHSIDLAEVKTGENLYNILKACAYHGYENNGTYEYDTLYELVMKYDMTGEEEPKETYRPSDFYPIIAQLSDGHRGMLKTGIVNLVLSVVVDAEQYQKSFEILKETIREQAKGECALESVNPEDPSYSIFGGIDRGLFEEDSGIAMMESAAKRTIQEKDFTFTGELTEKEKQKQIFTCLMIGSGATGAFALVMVAIGSLVVRKTQAVLIAGAQKFFGSGSQAAVAKLIQTYGKGTYAGVVQAQTIGRVVAQVFGVVLTVAIITLIVVALVFELKEIWKAPETADYIGIPRVVCNAQKITTYYMNLDGNYTVNHDADGYIYYYGVKNPTLKDDEQDDSKNAIGKDKIADVANWSQSGLRQWIALYTTKDLRAGQPILASSLEINANGFQFESRAVSMFDNGTSCDMQQYFKGTPIHKYLHYVMDTDYKPYTASAEKANEAGSVFTEPTTYAIGGLGLLLGVAGGCGITAVANKNKNKKKDRGETV